MATYTEIVKNNPYVVGYWELQEASGSTALDTAGTFPGTYTGSYVLEQMGCVELAAPQLDTGGYIRVPDAAGLDGFANGLTVEGWFYLDTVDTVLSIHKTAATAYSLLISGGRVYGYVRATPSQSTVASTVILAPKRWYHVVLCWRTGSSAEIYVNGVSAGVGGTNVTGALAANADDFRMDCSVGSGLLEQVALYNNHIGADEVATHTLYGMRERAHLQRVQAPSLLAPRLDFAPTSWPGSQMRANLQEVQLNIFRPGTQVNSDIVRH